MHILLNPLVNLSKVKDEEIDVDLSAHAQDSLFVFVVRGCVLMKIKHNGRMKYWGSV